VVSRLRAVFFDLGETLIDETRQWSSVAEQLGVPALTLFGVLGGVIERRQHHRVAIELLGAGAVSAAVWPPDVEPGDFYPDALPCLAACKAAGWTVGIAGNQPEGAADALRAMDLDVDVVATSAGWGVEKPSPEFFARVAGEAGCEPAEIAYVGDRVDNDVVPARDAGMVAVFLVRGPWGLLHASWPEAAAAHLTVYSLGDLPRKLAGLLA